MATMPFASPPSWQHVVVLVCSMILAICVLPTCTAQLEFTITKPQDLNPDGQFATWISIVGTSLLPPDSPGVFVGAIPADAVESVCQLIESGQLSINTRVTVGGSQQDHIFEVQATGGCDASSASPQGVELVYTDENGVTNAVVCDENTESMGCQLYATGDDVSSFVQGAYDAQDNGTDNGGGDGRRKLLQQNPQRDFTCDDAGIVGGTVGGALLASEICPPFLLLAPACAAATIFVSAVAGTLFCPAIMAGVNCFPGDSMVIIESGQRKLMSELTIGDKVGVWQANGLIHFDNVYAFGHADANSIGLFLVVTLEPLNVFSPTCIRCLSLSAGHFTPTTTGNGRILYKRAQDLELGDNMWATSCKKHGVSLFQVTRINLILKKGLYNPFTLGGTIIVDDVVASTHSEWFLDKLFDAMGISHCLPHAYQVVLSPVQFVYKICGQNLYQHMYLYLDKHLNIPQFGTKYGGIISLTWGATSIAISGVIIIMLKKAYKS